MKAKKHLGQHFLVNQAVIEKIIDLIKEVCPQDKPVLEVGPGQGVLTYHLDDHFDKFTAVEFDRDMIRVLIQKLDPKKLVNEDFLGLDLKSVYDGEFALVGNFPYNISSQIIFKMIANRHQIPVMVGMFQKEVAERICSTPGGKKNGILSLNAQAYYTAEKAFDIGPDAFDPPPRVESSIIVLKRKENFKLPCDEVLYKKVIKMAFLHRRKMLRNTIKTFVEDTSDPIFQMRPEQLSVEQFVNIVTLIEEQNKKK